MVCCCSEVTTPEKKVEDVEKVETEKKVEDSADEPSVPETVNGHDKEASKEEEEPSENGTVEDAEEKEAESTENGTGQYFLFCERVVVSRFFILTEVALVTAEVTATKRKSTGAEESAEAAAEGVSPEKKAKLADAEEKEASNGTVEAEATA